MVIVLQSTVDYMNQINPQLLFELDKLGVREAIKLKEQNIKYYKFTDG